MWSPLRIYYNQNMFYCVWVFFFFFDLLLACYAGTHVLISQSMYFNLLGTTTWTKNVGRSVYYLITSFVIYCPFIAFTKSYECTLSDVVCSDMSGRRYENIREHQNPSYVFFDMYMSYGWGSRVRVCVRRPVKTSFRKLAIIRTLSESRWLVIYQ